MLRRIQKYLTFEASVSTYKQTILSNKSDIHVPPRQTRSAHEVVFKVASQDIIG